MANSTLGALNQTQLELLQRYDGQFRKLEDKANALKKDWQKIADSAKKQIDTTNKLVNEKVEWAEGEINELTSSFLWGKNFVSRNLIKDAMVRHLNDDGKPLYFGTRGSVKVEAVHPFTKGFEGPYAAKKPDNAVDNPEDADKNNPYWYGRYYKGPRISRGGLADGWNGIRDGHILKITKPANTSASGFNSLVFTKTNLALVNKIVFQCYVKIVKGRRVGFGQDSGYSGSARGHIVTKEQTDKAPQGWAKVEAIIGTSNVTNPFSSNFLLGFDKADEIEMYLALPTAYVVPSDGYRIQTVQED